MTAKDRRLLDKCGNALRDVADWLRELDHPIDGGALDKLGELIADVDEHSGDFA